MARVAAIVLAAGEASRFGSPKQRLLLPSVLERVRASSVHEIVVVAGAYDLDPDDDVRIVTCPEWRAGPGASLRCGVSALDEGVEAAVVALADGPELSPAAVDRIIGEWRRSGGIVAASYEGSRGHPLVLGRADWRDIPDDGLRDRPVRLVPCDDLGAPGDVDAPEDLRLL
jgi:CTP:molybdopterin cytidylyltransferase MocA